MSASEVGLIANIKLHMFFCWNLVHHPNIDSVFSYIVGCITLDTVCFSSEAKRATQKDFTIAEKLETFYPQLDRNNVFDELQKAKSDISGKRNYT